MIGSRRFRLADAMSILVQHACASRRETRQLTHALEQVEILFTERSRHGLSLPGSVSVPRYSRIWSGGQVADIRLALLDQSTSAYS